MANHAVSVARRAVPERAFDAWMSFMLSSSGLGLKWGDAGNGEKAVLAVSTDVRGGDSLGDVCVWLNHDGQVELRHCGRGVGEHIADFAFTTATAAFGSPLVFDDGIGRMITDVSPFSFLERANECCHPGMPPELSKDFQRDQKFRLAGRGLSPEAFGLDEGPLFGRKVLRTAKGFSCFLSDAPPEEPWTAAEAEALLLPFSSLGGEPPPSWLTSSCGKKGVTRALACACAFGNAEAALALAPFAAPLSEADRRWILGCRAGAARDGNCGHPSEAAARSFSEAAAAAVLESVDLSLAAETKAPEPLSKKPRI